MRTPRNAKTAPVAAPLTREEKMNQFRERAISTRLMFEQRIKDHCQGGRERQEAFAQASSQDAAHAIEWAEGDLNEIFQGQWYGKILDLKVAGGKEYRAILAAIREELTDALLNGNSDYTPTSTSAFHNAICLTRAEAARKFLRDDLRHLEAILNHAEEAEEQFAELAAEIPDENLA